MPKRLQAQHVLPQLRPVLRRRIQKEFKKLDVFLHSICSHREASSTYSQVELERQGCREGISGLCSQRKFQGSIQQWCPPMQPHRGCRQQMGRLGWHGTGAQMLSATCWWRWHTCQWPRSLTPPLKNISRLDKVQEKTATQIACKQYKGLSCCAPHWHSLHECFNWHKYGIQVVLSWWFDTLTYIMIFGTLIVHG